MPASAREHIDYGHLILGSFNNKRQGVMQGGAIVRDDLVRLYYDQGRSMQQIAAALGCSLHKVAYWMERYGLERRTQSEATYVYRNPGGDPFCVRMPETPEAWVLFGMGLGLYMGEGSKTGSMVSIANSQPAIHRLFIAFLEQICGVRREQLKADLNIFDDCDVPQAIIWWADQLGMGVEQFSGPVVRKGREGSYTHKSVYGTLAIRFGNVKLKQIIDNWCSEYAANFSR